MKLKGITNGPLTVPWPKSDTSGSLRPSFEELVLARLRRPSGGRVTPVSLTGTRTPTTPQPSNSTAGDAGEAVVQSPEKLVRVRAL